jgi:hypothetical protein
MDEVDNEDVDWTLNNRDDKEWINKQHELFIKENGYFAYFRATCIYQINYLEF